MPRKVFVAAALAIVVSTAFLLFRGGSHDNTARSSAFVRTRGSQFVVAGKPFRFAGANVSVMYRDEDRARMPETMRQASQAGMSAIQGQITTIRDQINRRLAATAPPLGFAEAASGAGLGYAEEKPARPANPLRTKAPPHIRICSTSAAV